MFDTFTMWHWITVLASCGALVALLIVITCTLHVNEEDGDDDVDSLIQDYRFYQSLQDN